MGHPLIASARVKLQGLEIQEVPDLKYIGSVVQNNVVSGREMKKWVQAGWDRKSKLSGVLCDRRLPARIVWTCPGMESYTVRGMLRMT